MNKKDRDSLADLLHQINDRFQDLSHKIHWTAEDSECLDNLVGSKEQINIITGRITRATGSGALTMYLPLLLAFKGWQRTKAVIRICLAARFSLDETQKALILYGMAPLYIRIPRDVVFLSAINHRLYDVHQVNDILLSCGQEPLF